MKTILSVSVLSALASSALALTAADDASNYGSWTNGSTGGSGFGVWDLTNNNNNGSDTFAGYFLGDSTTGAADINTGGNSFGIYANPGAAFATATRSFSSALSVNDQFTVNLGVNFDNGNKGFNLRSGGTTVFGFNVGGGAQINTAFSNNASTASYDYGGNAMIEAVILVTSANSVNYEIRRTSSEGTQGLLYAGSITGITGSIDNLEFYNSGTGDGLAQNNLYFNSLSVTNVPEPGTFALLSGCLALLWVVQRRRG